MGSQLFSKHVLSSTPHAHSFRSPPIKSLRILSKRQHRYAAVCQAASTQKGEQRSRDSTSEKGSEFPSFESDSKDDGEFLPVRQPGEFPSIAVRPR